MLKIYKEMIGGLLFIWVMAIGIGYFTTIGDETTVGRMFFVVATSVFMSLVILMIVVIDKNERSENSKELRIHHFIRATIDDVVDIQKQQGNHTYKVYTDTDVYMVDYEKTSIKIIHVGEYQRVDIEG